MTTKMPTYVAFVVGVGFRLVYEVTVNHLSYGLFDNSLEAAISSESTPLTPQHLISGWIRSDKLVYLSLQCIIYVYYY